MRSSYILPFLAPVVSALALVFALAIAARAEVQTFGPFSIDSKTPEVITLRGDIDAGAALNFRRALQVAPKAGLLSLDSSGGVVQMGLLIADDVYQRKMATYIPREGGCYSACAYIFLAGGARQADGKLGVHQISSDTNDLVGAQVSISDIIDQLNRFGTPVEVLTAMFKTPPKDMYVFTSEEVTKFKINRIAATAIETTAEVHKATPEAPPTFPDQQSGVRIPGQLPEGVSSELSVIEQYARRPTRMAIFTGLDLFGDDIASQRTSGAGECARVCLSMDGQCRAFTFNIDPQAKRGPNCFLKSSQGTADGNAVAISGTFLGAADPDPTNFSMGTIDPNSALFENVDLPGGDLSSRAYGRNVTAQQCRLVCVENDQCVGFTYIKRKSECWLKGAIGTPRFAEGMVSGLKKKTTFSPASIISLD